MSKFDFFLIILKSYTSAPVCFFNPNMEHYPQPITHERRILFPMRPTVREDTAEALKREYGRCGFPPAFSLLERMNQLQSDPRPGSRGAVLCVGVRGANPSHTYTSFIYHT